MYYLTEAGKYILSKTRDEAEKQKLRNQEWAALSPRVKRKRTRHEKLKASAEQAEDLGIRNR
tara:strand:- start:437 stop:622 length:186 start_codon:yes stop_codon:yes gene_type:complete